MARSSISLRQAIDLNLRGATLHGNNNNWQGSTAPLGSVAYSAGDIVVHNSILWLALRDSDGVEPGTSDMDWQLVGAGTTNHTPFGTPVRTFADLPRDPVDGHTLLYAGRPFGYDFGECIVNQNTRSLYTGDVVRENGIAGVADPLRGRIELTVAAGGSGNVNIPTSRDVNNNLYTPTLPASDNLGRRLPIAFIGPILAAGSVLRFVGIPNDLVSATGEAVVYASIATNAGAGFIVLETDVPRSNIGFADSDNQTTGRRILIAREVVRPGVIFWDDTDNRWRNSGFNG